MQINIEKKHLYFLVILSILTISISYAIAYGTSNPSIFGHSIGEIDGAVKSCDKTGWDIFKRSDITQNQYTCHSASSAVAVYWSDPKDKTKLLKPTIKCNRYYSNSDHSYTGSNIDFYTATNINDFCANIIVNGKKTNGFPTIGLCYTSTTSSPVRMLDYSLGTYTQCFEPSLPYPGHWADIYCCYFDWDTNPTLLP